MCLPKFEGKSSVKALRKSFRKHEEFVAIAYQNTAFFLFVETASNPWAPGIKQQYIANVNEYYEFCKRLRTKLGLKKRSFSGYYDHHRMTEVVFSREKGVATWRDRVKDRLVGQVGCQCYYCRRPLPATTRRIIDKVRYFCVECLL